MKILFDHQLFSWQKYGGASKYFAHLLAHLPRECWETTTIFSNNAYVDDLNLFSHISVLPQYTMRGQGRLLHELNKPYTSYKLWKKDYDVYHQMHFDPFGLKYIGKKPMVTTFHDINFITLNPKPDVVKWQKKSLERANRIIAISQNTKKDILEYFDVNPDKIDVIYHGIDRVDRPLIKPLFDFPYILYVGTRGQHKNFDRFIRAYAAYAEKYTDINLVCTWKDFTVAEKELFQKLGIEKRVFHISASEIEMTQLYRDALFFIFPSLYEGFGMPILEAMLNDCPVALANASCFPEIAKDAAMYFNPYEIDDMVAIMSAMTDSKQQREALISKGQLRVADFSWERCAEEHMKVYQSLI